MHLTRKHKKITPTNSRGRDAKPPIFVAKSRKNAKNLPKSTQKFLMPRQKFFLTRLGSLCYTIREERVGISRQSKRHTRKMRMHGPLWHFILALIGAQARFLYFCTFQFGTLAQNASVLRIICGFVLFYGRFCAYIRRFCAAIWSFKNAKLIYKGFRSLKWEGMTHFRRPLDKFFYAWHQICIDKS